jgi:SAM-dependent methyltransferase
VDVNAEILRTATARVAAAGWTNVEFRPGDVGDVSGTEFDAVVGRWVLMYVDDPVEAVRGAAARLRPGGVVAFQEGVFNEVRAPFPSGPLHDQVLRWMTPPPGAPGPHVQMGLKLHETFLAAGLRRPGLRIDTPIGGGSDWAGYAYLVATLRSLLPFLVQFGIVMAEEVDIDTLADRLRDEVVERNGVQFLPPLVGAWSYRI